MISEQGLKKYQQLRQAYQASFKLKRDTLRGLWQTAESNGWTHASADNLRQQLHRLAGSAASYGFESISQHATKLEELLLVGLDTIPRETYFAFTCRVRSALDRLITELETEADRTVSVAETRDR